MSYLHFTSGTRVFWRLRLLHGMVYKSFIRLRSFLGKLRTSCEVSFFYLQFGSKYDRLRHAHIIMRSRIWFELSDRGATPPHVTRKVFQNTRTSFSHVRGGAGHETKRAPGTHYLRMRLIATEIPWRSCSYVYVRIWWRHKLAALMCKLVFCSSEFYIALF